MAAITNLEERIAEFVRLNEQIRIKTGSAESEFLASIGNLTLIQLRVIAIIANHQRCTMGELAKHSCLTLGAITQIIDKLIDKELVTRKRDTNDRRVVYAQLTAQGNAVNRKEKEHVQKICRQFFQKITADEQQALIDIMRRLLQ